MILTDEAVEGLKKRGVTLEETVAETNQRTARKKRSNYEFEQQVELFKWLRLWEQKDKRLVWVHASLNGVRLTPKTAKGAYAAGMKKGIWDITIDHEGAFTYIGARIEMKSPGKKLTPEQVDFQNAHPQFCYRVCFTWHQAAQFICDYFDITDPDIRGGI
jgi:hypothetical protein